MIFPFIRQDLALQPEDFVALATSFSGTVLELIPFVQGPVRFVLPESEEARDRDRGRREAIASVFKEGRPSVLTGQSILFLPVWRDAAVTAVIVVEGIETGFADKLSVEWLLDRSRLISREFILLRQLVADPVTGLFNSRHLITELENLLADPGSFSLFLLEIRPRGKEVDKRLQYINRVAYFLVSLSGSSLVHHLGDGVFGLVWPDIADAGCSAIGKKILTWLKRENFRNAHLGITTVKQLANNELSKATKEKDNAATIFGQAWKSLRTASGRGPFAMCTYSSISQPDNHPLRPPARSVMRRLARFWQGEAVFSLVLLQSDGGAPDGQVPVFPDAINTPPVRLVELNQRECFVFLPDADAAAARDWVDSFKQSAAAVLPRTFSAGIAVYPCLDFSKSAMPGNARKALLHTAFYGRDTATVFDALSLNVSGDIYYNDGDLVRAVKEYLKGLRLDPVNINLLNSLGEAYARLNRHRQALQIFARILAIEPNHYMALFNQGAVLAAIGDDRSALAVFEKAMQVRDGQPDLPVPAPHFDLLFQLGRLYCRNGRYNEAIALLGQATGADKETVPGSGQGLLLRYLGEAHLMLGNNRQAISVLQRALRLNARDAVSLGMLGVLYGLENQGDDIALSLCRQAVDIDEGWATGWLFLAWIEDRLNQWPDALKSLQFCLKCNRKNRTALLLKGRILSRTGQQKKATAVLEKLTGMAPSERDMAAVLGLQS